MSPAAARGLMLPTRCNQGGPSGVPRARSRPRRGTAAARLRHGRRTTGSRSSGTTARRTSACRRRRCSPRPTGSGSAGCPTTARATAGRRRGPDRSIGSAADDVARRGRPARASSGSPSMGHSGGGTHALACGALLPGRVTAVASMAGARTVRRRGARLLRRDVPVRRRLPDRRRRGPGREGAPQGHRRRVRPRVHRRDIADVRRPVGLVRQRRRARPSRPARRLHRRRPGLHRRRGASTSRGSACPSFSARHRRPHRPERARRVVALQWVFSRFRDQRRSTRCWSRSGSPSSSRR